MKFLLILALLFAALPGIAADVSPSKDDMLGSARSDTPDPRLVRLERVLARQLEAKSSGRLTPEAYQTFLSEFCATLDATMAHVPPTPENKGLHAQVLSRLGEAERAQALTSLNTALEADPKSPALLRAKGQIYFEQKNYPNAAESAMQAWEYSGRADKAAWALYQMSKGRAASDGADDAAPPKGDASQGAKLGLRTKADDEHVNGVKAQRQILVPGGRIDRGVPNLGHIASEAAANTPMGPLTEKFGDRQQSGLGTVAAVAFTATGALLLFGGLGGKLLNEKYPNIRRDMGIAAGVSGAIAIGAISLPRIAPLVLSTPRLAERARNAIVAAESPQGQQLGMNVAQRLGSQPGTVQTLTGAPTQVSQELQNALAVGERIRNLLMPRGRMVGSNGSSADIRIMRGTIQDAEQFFVELTRGVQVATHPRGGVVGKLAKLPNGGYIGLRYASNSGPPTIDIDVPGFEAIRKIKFLSQ